MDSIFEYLIILFFIFSILQGIFSKKKKEAEKKQPPQNRGRNIPEKTYPTETKKEKSAEEILGEMFGFPTSKPKEDTSIKREPRNYDYPQTSEENVQTWDPASEFGIESTQPVKKKTTFSEKSAAYDKTQSYSKVKIPKLDELIKQSAATSSKLKRIKKLLSNQQSIRDMIIAQEILNKPKAFRD